MPAASVVITALGRSCCLGSESTYDWMRVRHFIDMTAQGDTDFGGRSQAAEEQEGPRRTMNVARLVLAGGWSERPLWVKGRRN